VLLRWIFWIQISVHVRVSPQLGGSDARSLHLMEAAEQNPERFLWTGTQSERDQNQQLYYSRTESFYATHAQIHAAMMRREELLNGESAANQRAAPCRAQ
ncbi:hypothetical protein GOODEAATRI_025170, partial [Goodea atripinnis]